MFGKLFNGFKNNSEKPVDPVEKLDSGVLEVAKGNLLKFLADGNFADERLEEIVRLKDIIVENSDSNEPNILESDEYINAVKKGIGNYIGQGNIDDAKRFGNLFLGHHPEILTEIFENK